MPSAEGVTNATIRSLGGTSGYFVFSRSNRLPKKIGLWIALFVAGNRCLGLCERIAEKKSKYIQVVHVPFFGGANFQVR